ncbi:MAG: hypothetical protein VZS44_09105 [Bacilli bacterium]|nr:hypothetical protein [Bacilli bacterium]
MGIILTDNKQTIYIEVCIETETEYVDITHNFYNTTNLPKMNNPTDRYDTYLVDDLSKYLNMAYEWNTNKGAYHSDTLTEEELNNRCVFVSEIPNILDVKMPNIINGGSK